MLETTKNKESRKEVEVRRKGFALIDLVFAFIIIAIIVSSSFRAFSLFKIRNEYTLQRERLALFAKGIPQYFLAVRDYLSQYCGKEGVESVYCDDNSAFPFVYDGKVIFRIDRDLPEDAKDYLKSLQEGLLKPLGCVFLKEELSSGAYEEEYFCKKPEIVSLNYYLTSGETVNDGDSLVFGAPTVSPLAFPVQLEVKAKEYFGEKAKDTTYQYSFPYLFENLKRESQRRINTIADALRSYALQRLTYETQVNQYPSGMSSTDDFFVPWVWQILADDAVKANTPCQGENCSNFDSTIWKTSLSSKRTLIKKIVDYVGGGSSYLTDAFLFPYEGIPIGNGCEGDLSTCSADNNAPPKPQQNYDSVYFVRPPFFSWVYSSACVAKGDSWCRTKVVYEN